MREAPVGHSWIIPVRTIVHHVPAVGYGDDLRRALDGRADGESG
jgi:hypothetical protein